MAKTNLTRARLRELLHYSRRTGVFTWRKAASPRVKRGDVAGTLSKAEGYIRIQVDGVVYNAHRLAIFYVTGEWPPQEVDHWNAVRHDNRWDNIRPATKAQNMQNKTRASKLNGSGLLGAYATPSGSFVSWTNINGVRTYHGSFPTAQEAHDAYCAFKRKALPGWEPRY